MEKVSNSQIKFSIIVPVYNRAKIVNKAIDSVIKQTYQNWELVLINDGSKDNSLEILKQYEQKDLRIKVYDKENGGVCSARNCGIENADGDYLLFLDSDDEHVDCTLSTLVEAIKKFGCLDVFTFGISFGEIQNKSLPTGYEFNKVFNKEQIKEIVANILHLNKDSNKKEFFPFCPIKAYKRSVLNEYNIRFDENLKTWEDNYFNICFLKYASSLLFLEDSLYLVKGLEGELSLSKMYCLDTIQKIPYKYELIYNLYKNEFNFDNVYMANWYCEMLNTQVLKLLKTDEDIGLVETKKVLQNSNVKKWFNLAKAKNKYEKKIARSIVLGELSKIQKLYLKYDKYLKRQYFLKKIKAKLGFLK